MTDATNPVLLRSWRNQAPSITDAEVAALLPIVTRRLGPVAGLLAAYRAGARSVKPAPLPIPNAGSEGCPNCLSVEVAGVSFEPVKRDSADPDGPGGRYAVMLSRCATCGTRYRGATGEVFPPAGPGTVLDVPTTEGASGG